ncbi:uncharacterized protein Fot_04942 [Forsythia ovata]|uniref:Uncharacterized protein n=1 Tax=Forsythia ovata TaxID=205694 RepID=A0ABD1WNQ5_9LAMI
MGDMASSKNSMKKILEIRSEMGILEILIYNTMYGDEKIEFNSFITKLISKNEDLYKVYDLIKIFRCTWDWEFRDRARRYLFLIEDLRLLFSIPKLQSATPSNIHKLEVFIDFLLEVVAKSDWSGTYLQGQNQNFQTDLKLLIAYLGDRPSQAIELDETNSVFTDIEALVNEVGSFLYSVFFTGYPVYLIEIDPSLSDLLEKFEILNTKIEKHCTTVSKIQTDMPTKTVVVSLFIVDSLLDDLKDLMNNKADTIVEVKDQFKTIYE